jgi:ABC-type lipoprotein export system ATPase subunit
LHSVRKKHIIQSEHNYAFLALVGYSTVIIVTHDENISKQCDRIIRIEDGYIKEDFRYEKTK